MIGFSLSMEAKVVLAARVKDGSSNKPVLAVEIKNRAIVLPVVRKDGRKFVLPVDGKEQNVIVYFLARYPENGKRVSRSLGLDPGAAYTQYLQIEQDFARKRAGLLSLVPEKTVPRPPTSLQAAGVKFNQDVTAQGLKKASIRGYMDAVHAFVMSCRKDSIEDVDRDDMLAYVRWLRANLQKRKFGDQNHTIRTRLRHVGTFLNHFGKVNPLPTKSWPKGTRRNPDRYSLGIVNQMLKVANENEKDLIQFFLNTGFRDEEGAYAYYSDINFKAGTINVHEKPEYGWSTKNHAQRAQDIVLSKAFLKRMKARRDRNGSSKLIFPSSVGKPDMHLVRILQTVAEKAKIEGRVTLHKMRRTFGSLVSKQFGLEQARLWLGHADIATTQRYIAADEMVSEYSKKQVNTMFEALGD